MQLTFLSADQALTKTYVKTADGIDSTPYPLTTRMTSHVIDVSTIEEFHANLVAYAKRSNCLLKGNLQRDIKNESRRGLMKSESTNWICLDFDGMDLGNNTVDGMLIELGLGDVDYILQYSASHGIKEGLNAHVFMLLDKPSTPEHLKIWLKTMNLTIPRLRNQLELTKTKMALHWPLDITVCQADKLLYIAPPNLRGWPEPPVKDRITLNKRKERRGHLSAVSSDPKAAEHEVIRQLRAAEGLKDHKLEQKYDVKLDVHYMVNPDQAAVSGVKRNGKFTYLNLNGGDSWAYYHRTDNPTVLHNFKGEPSYRLRELAPEYYGQACERANQMRREAHVPVAETKRTQRFVINERKESVYYKVTWHADGTLQLDPAKTQKHIYDWCALNGLTAPDAIDDWDIVFDPTSTKVVDAKNKELNVYVPTKFRTISSQRAQKLGMLAAPTERFDLEAHGIPKPYAQLIHHVCGSDDEAAWRFVNWLSFMWQTGKKPGTAWTFHGTFGTGKGRLAELLRRMFGQHFTVITPEQLNQLQNDFIKTAQILWIDEIDMDAWDSPSVGSKLKNWISDPMVSYRAMYKGADDIRSFMGIIVAANVYNPVEVKLRDRRWNIAPRQETKLHSEYVDWATPEMIDDEIGWLYQDDNIMEFSVALQRFPVVSHLVREPLENETKNQVMRVTQSLPEDIVAALHTGNAGFFLHHLADLEAIPSAEAVEYRQVVELMMKGGEIALKNAEIATIFKHIAGWNQAIGKFSKAAGKFGLDIANKKARRALPGGGTESFAGTYYTFSVTAEDRAYWAQQQPKDHGLRAVKEGA